MSGITIQTISSMEFSRAPGELLKRVRGRFERFLIASDGKPEAVLIPVSTYEQYERIREEAGVELKRMLEEIWQNVDTSGATEEEIDQVIDQAVKEVREGNYR